MLANLCQPSTASMAILRPRLQLLPKLTFWHLQLLAIGVDCVSFYRYWYWPGYKPCITDRLSCTWCCHLLVRSPVSPILAVSSFSESELDILLRHFLPCNTTSTHTLKKNYVFCFRATSSGDLIQIYHDWSPLASLASTASSWKPSCWTPSPDNSQRPNQLLSCQRQRQTVQTDL